VGTRTAQGRMTGWVLGLLPIILGFAIYVFNPSYMEKLWQTETGLTLLYSAAGMTVIGGLIIRKIVNVKI